MTEEMIQLGHIGLNVRYSLTDKPGILFLHFSGGNLHMWDGIVPQFNKDYSIIAPDLRGHGKSDKPATGYHIDDMAKDMYLLLKRLNVGHCHVVGSSMGAEVGLSLAASHPKLVLSLVCEGALSNEFGEYGLFNGTAEEIEQKKAAWWAGLVERPDPEFNTKEEYIEKEREKLIAAGLWNENFRVFFEHNLQQLPNGKFTHCCPNQVRTQYAQEYWDVKFEQYYEKVKCPVLFLPSEEEWNDEKVRRNLTSFASLLDTYEIQHIKDSIHAYVWMQFPIAAGKAVKRFFEKGGWTWREQEKC